MVRLPSKFPQALLPAVASLSLIVSCLAAQSPTDSLKFNFKNPPADSRPMVRWWWFGAAVEKPEILRELQQMKSDGIGGAELAFVYPEVLDDPAKNQKNLPFLSPAMLDAVHYAQAEGRRLGLRIDVTLCSGWPYGGPDTTLAEAASRLRTAEVLIPANVKSISLPKFDQGDSLLSASIVPGEPQNWSAASVRPLPLQIPEDTTELVVEPSDYPRTALFFISSHTRQQVKRAAVGAEGYVLDPFSPTAVATHLKAVGEPLIKAFGDTPPYAIFSDSLEAYGADWTPTLPAEFLKRRGYDLLPHLPELVAGGTPAAEKVRHDWGQTLTELVNENYLTQINHWAIDHHTKFRSQTYGEPAVTFSSQHLVALPEGEGPQWRAFSTLRWATSANHVFGNNVTSGETFTWLHSPVFRATPLDMKAEADIDFIMGENQLIFHGWPYSPPNHKVPEPGWSLYAAAVFNDHNPWHPVMPDVTRYIQRISYLLRQGQPANQVAILLPTDDAWASFSPGSPAGSPAGVVTPAHVTVTGAMQKLISPQLISTILSAGYNLDFIDAEAINTVGLGTHQILILPPTDRIPYDTVNKISLFAAEGGKVIVVGHAPSVTSDGKPINPIVFKSFSTFVADESHLTEALDNAGDRDFKISSPDDHTKEVVGFIRRKLPSADIYFVANTSNQQVYLSSATFGTSFKYGQAWDTDSALSFAVTPTSQAITLDPYESRIFVFSNSKTATPFIDCCPEGTDISTDWRVTFTSTKETETEPTLTDWTINPATLYYSGEAIYSRDFTMLPVAASAQTFLKIDGGKPLPGSPNSPPEHPALGPNGLPDPRITRPGPGMHAYYDPPIHEAAIVFVNGQRAGSLWHPPYQLDVSKFLKPGENHIEIRVYNTALNAWSALPPHDYKPLIEKYGDRFQMQDLDKVQPIPSGILGTIQLVTQDTK